jgi:hypothetical protein
VSNYTKSTNFATKDALASGNPLKIVKGTEIDTEFNNIATAVATKADLASPTFTGTPTLPTGTVAVTQSAGNNTTAIATTAFVQAAIALLYPVGSIYTNATVSTNPATLLGFGTWTAFGAGRVMVGFDSGNALFDTAEETGGSADAITVSHTHTATSTDAGHFIHQNTTSMELVILVVVAHEFWCSINSKLNLEQVLQVLQQQLRLLVQVAQMLTTSRTLLCICGKERHEKP